MLQGRILEFQVLNYYLLSTSPPSKGSTYLLPLFTYSSCQQNLVFLCNRYFERIVDLGAPGFSISLWVC